MTLRELAARAGCTQATIANIERPGGNPSAALLAQICNVLQLDVRDVLRPAS
jgi:transcriptional regulator with XRE-family HTH domain